MPYGSNLPPGVTDSMIPGNRPEDYALEVLAEEIAERVDELISSLKSTKPVKDYNLTEEDILGLLQEEISERRS